MAETVVVTDGTDSFFGSRSVFQVLHDAGDFSSLTAFSSSIVDAKKMCISRQARYSGLIDVLKFAEGGDAELAATLSGVSTWVAINGDAAKLPAQISAAAGAGVKRIFVHLSAADAAPDEGALKAALEASGAAYTVMRTGTLAKAGAGGGLVVGDFELPTCEDVPIDDAFRLLVESLTIPEAEGRFFSLCPSVDDSQLKEMRRAGCSRKEEAVALLKGVIVEKAPEEREAIASGSSAAAAAEDDDPRSEEEKAAAAEEEVKMLLERARAKGIENQKKMAEEEAEKAAKRAERLAYFKDNAPKEEDEEAKDAKDGDNGDDEDKKGDDGEGGDKKKDDKPKKDGDDDDDGLALV